MSRYGLDLNYIAWRQKHRALLALGSWFDDRDGEGPKPALVLMLERDFGAKEHALRQGREPCVVRLNHLWAFDEAEGNHADAVRCAMAFAPHLALDPKSYPQVMWILSIIRDHIEDAIRIPPRPIQLERVAADAVLFDRESGKLIEFEIREDV